LSRGHAVIRSRPVLTFSPLSPAQRETGIVLLDSRSPDTAHGGSTSPWLVAGAKQRPHGSGELCRIRASEAGSEAEDGAKGNGLPGDWSETRQGERETRPRRKRRRRRSYHYDSAVQGLALERSLRSERSGETERTEDERSEAERRQANRSEWRNKASTDKHDARAGLNFGCVR
jgi:hypothetical protein